MVAGLPEILRAGFAPLPHGVVLADPDGTIVFVNRAFEHLVGCTAPEIIGRSIQSLVPETAGALRAAFQGSAPEDQPMGMGSQLFARRKDGTEVPVEVGVSPLVVGERSFVIAAISDATQRHRGEADLRKTLDDRIDFEALVSELSARFVNLPLDEVDRSIEEGIARLARALSLDRIALFQIVEPAGDFVHTHQWTRPGWASLPTRIPASEQFPWHLSQVRVSEAASFTRMEDIPDEVDREGFRREGTRSSVTIPLVIRGRPWGGMTFATIGDARSWTVETVNRLRVIAHVFANVLARKQADEAQRVAVVENATTRARLRDENAYLRHELQEVAGAPTIVGHSAGIRRVFEQVRQVAATDATVLLVGEIGTGKSILAQRIHESSARRERVMVRVNCGGLAAASVDGDPFGPGTGTSIAREARLAGLLELANGSTVFLDEVADLPADAQAMLARILQSREIRLPGKTPPVKIDVRVIAATRRNLVGCIQEGTFREDLHSRLYIVPIHVPPLRERTDDIPLLVWRFVDEFSQTYRKTIDTIDQESMTLLKRYKWPGNGRELRNVVERAMLAANSRRLRIVVPAARARTRGIDTLAAVERAHIAAVMAACGGEIRGKNGAAARLGLSPNALEARLARLGLRRRRVSRRG